MCKFSAYTAFSKLDLCEGLSFSTAIFNRDIRFSSVYSFLCFISVCPFVTLLRATYAENLHIVLSCRYLNGRQKDRQTEMFEVNTHSGVGQVDFVWEAASDHEGQHVQRNQVDEEDVASPWRHLKHHVDSSLLEHLFQHHPLQPQTAQDSRTTSTHITPETIRPTLEPVQSQHEGKTCEMGLSTYGLTGAPRYHLELNWSELIKTGWSPCGLSRALRYHRTELNWTDRDGVEPIWAFSST